MSFATVTVMAVATLVCLMILSATALRAWNGWLDLKRTELAREGKSPTDHALGMIDLSDLKERLRKLEAIAAGVDP